MAQKNRVRRRFPKTIGVPFMRIPFLAQKIIVGQIDPLDSIHFSLNCERYREVILKAKVEADVLKYQFTSAEPKLLIEHQGNYISILTTTQLMRVRKPPNYRLAGEKTVMEVHRTRVQACSFTVALLVPDNRESTSVGALKKFTYHLLQFLLPEKVLVLYNRPQGLNDVLTWSYVPCYNEITIGSNNTIEGLGDEEKNFILEQVKSKHLHFEFADSDDLLAPCLQRWLSEDDVEYKVDQVTFTTEMINEEFLQVCDAFHASPTGFTEENIISRQPFKVEDCITGTQRDIQRDRDGKTITMIYFQNTVTLLFWNETTLKAAGRL